MTHLPSTSTQPPGIFAPHSLLSEVDWEALKPYFGWAPIPPVQNTFNITTRYGAAASNQDYLKKHFKARNPVFNIPG